VLLPLFYPQEVLCIPEKLGSGDRESRSVMTVDIDRSGVAGRGGLWGWKRIGWGGAIAACLGVLLRYVKLGLARKVTINLARLLKKGQSLCSDSCTGRLGIRIRRQMSVAPFGHR